jgi:predicted unusual protein kinase regulating ubiquinone biosynthesis (AarF/ABC1/UbiB family)
VEEFSILINEYYKLLKEEIDFVRDVQNMERFGALFQSKKFMKIPKAFKTYCTNDVIVMEYVPAFRIDDVTLMKSRGFNTPKIAQKLIDVFFDQILNFGIIHIDPHPGNVGITSEGKIVFYDYGMVQTINIDFKKNLKDILMALYEKNVDYICKLLIDNEIIVCQEEQLPYLKNFVLSFLGYLNNMDINDFKTNYIDNVDKSEKLAEFLRLEAIAKADAFQGPRLELERVAEELEAKYEALREWKGSGTVWET